MKKKLTLFLALWCSVGTSLAAITVRLNPKSCSSWSSVQLWAWTATEDLFETPISVNTDNEGWYSYTFDESIESVNIIWLNGKDKTNKTIDIKGITTSTCFALNTSIGTNIRVNIVDCNTYEYVKIGDLYYNLNGISRTAEVTSCEGYLENVSIPESVIYNDINYDVTSVCNNAFCNNISLKSVCIGNNVTRIGEAAFSYCEQLSSIIIPNSVMHIGDNAFAWCYSLTSINLSHSLTRIEDGLFRGCYSLSSIVIPNSVTEIGEYAFANCSFTSFTIPNQITHIGRWAFANCSSLNSIIWNATRMVLEHQTQVPFGGVESQIISFTFGEEVESIPDWLCMNMENMTSVTIPNSVTYIGPSTFTGCSSLQSITLTAQSIEEYCNGEGNMILYASGMGRNVKRNLLINGFEMKEIIIPMDVKNIGSYAFYGCSDLISIYMHDSITNIGANAFDGCSSLTSITISDNVKSIGEDAFSNCSSLNAVIWNAKNCADFSSIEKSPFYGNRSLITLFTFGEEVENIPAYLCDGMDKISSLIIPNSVTTIGQNAFNGCSSLTSLDIPNNVQTIGKNAFRNCSSIESVIIGKSVASIGENAFANCNSINSVTWNAKHCSSFGICYIGYIDGELFQIFDSSPFTTNVSTFSFGNEVEYIPSCLCLGMKNLTSITIPNSVTSIGSGAFYGCTALTSVNIPQKVNSIDMMAFAGCPSRTSITVANGNSTYDSRNNCNAIIEKTTNTLIAGCKNTTIPNDVLHIDDYAFYGGGSSFTSMTIPASVETIGEFAFGECPRLYDIYCYAAIPPIAKQSSFSNYNAFVHVPCESQRYYVLDGIWSKFKNYECITSDNVTTDGVYTTPSTNDVTIIWPIETGADSYTIVIMKETEVVCTLTFNADGQLLNIAFAPSRDGSRPAQHTQYAEQTTDGYRFTVTGLEAATHYTYDITVKDIANNTIKTHSGEFTTKSMTAVENISTNDANIQKIMRNGQLIILRDGVEYNAVGQELGN